LPRLENRASERFRIPAFAVQFIVKPINSDKLIMRQEDDLSGLAKVMDFMRTLILLSDRGGS
jgi:hypothetical protein